MERKLLSKTKFYFFLFTLSLFIAGCDFSCKKDEIIPLETQLQDSTKLLSFVKEKINPDIGFAIFDTFELDAIKKIAVCREISNLNEWGIRFGYYAIMSDSLVQLFETNLLEGATDESIIKSLSLPEYPNKLLYYNSNSYFMGSGGGEVFIYIVDFNTKQINYGHLIISPRYPVSLFLSNKMNKSVSDFIIGEFKKDYPTLRIIKKDLKLEE